MASFVDNRPYQFKEFVQTTPIESMVKVGMHKQEQFDQNVQKIQTAKDELAGLPVMRDVDKQYLQGMLTNLDTELTKVGAADFSKQQLVNSVAGAVSFISKDSNVMAAVQSTENHRNQQVKMEEARQKGQLTPSNEYNYQKQIAGYLQSDELGEVFNGDYKEYFDVYKHTKEHFDSVKPSGYTFDQVYITDANGKPLIDKATGKPVYSPTMVRLEQEGNLGAVKQALDAAFADPRVTQQLAIDGEYAYRGVTPEALLAGIEKQRVSNEAALDEELNDLTLKKTAGEPVQAGIDALSKRKTENKIQYDQLKKLAIDSPDAVRAIMYTDSVRNNYTSMFGWSKTKEQVLANPGWQANFDLEKERNLVRREQAKMSLEERKFAYQQQHDVVQDNIEFAKIAASATKAGQKIKNADGSTTTLPENTVLDFQPSDLELKSIMEGDYNKAGLNYNVTTDELIFSTVLDNDANRGTLKNYFQQGKTRPEALDLMIAAAAKKNGETPEQWRARWRQKSLVSLTDKPLDSDIATKVRNATTAGVLWQDQIVKKKTFDDAVRAQVGKDPVKMQDIVGDAKELTLSIPKGKQWVSVTLTPTDLYDYALFEKGSKVTANDLQKSQGEQAAQRLKQKGKYGAIPPQLARSEDYKKVQDRLDKNDQTYKTLEAETSILKRTYNISPNLRTTIKTGDTEGDRDLNQRVGDIVARYNSNNQNAVKIDNDFIQEAIAKGGYNVGTRKNNVTGEVVATIYFNKDGKEQPGIEISRDEAINIGVNVDDLYTSDEVKTIRNRISIFGNGTTSSSGAVKDISIYQSGDVAMATEKGNFPNLVNSQYKVRANIAESEGLSPAGGYSTTYLGYLYVNDGKDTYLIPTPPKPSLNEAVQATNGITIQYLQAAIAEQKAIKNKK